MTFDDDYDYRDYRNDMDAEAYYDEQDERNEEWSLFVEEKLQELIDEGNLAEDFDEGDLDE